MITMQILQGMGYHDRGSCAGSAYTDIPGGEVGDPLAGHVTPSDIRQKQKGLLRSRYGGCGCSATLRVVVACIGLVGMLYLPHEA